MKIPEIKPKTESVKFKVEPVKFKMEDKVPSNWSILPRPNGEIIATNTRTGQVFEGTVADFSKALK